MKATTTTLATVFALLSVGINNVSATCFGSGVGFEDKDNARYHANRACRGYDGNQGAFEGYFNPGEAKSACVNYNDQHYNMFVQNLNTAAGFTLNPDDCVFRLWNEITGCDRGGSSVTAGWVFTVDPNAGAC